MGTATLDRSPERLKALAVARAVELAEISAETAEWVADDLERREPDPAGSYVAAARRIRRRAASYRAEAERLRMS